MSASNGSPLIDRLVLGVFIQLIHELLFAVNGTDESPASNIADDITQVRRCNKFRRMVCLMYLNTLASDTASIRYVRPST